MKPNIRLLIFCCISVFAIVLMGQFNTFFNLNIKEQFLVHASTVEDYFVYLPIVVKPQDPEYKILFASTRDGTWNSNTNSWNYDLFLMDENGENPINLTNTPDINEDESAWSPDGTKIAYMSGDEGAREIYIMDANSTNKINVSNTPFADERHPVWAPNSSKLGFMSDRDDQDGVFDVFVVNPDGSGLVNLTNSTNADEWTMDWSPDGSKIVYLADQSTHPIGLLGHIMTMNANGSNKQTIYSGIGFNYSPVWTPNGTKITFNYNGECLAMINSNGSNFDPCFTNTPHLDGLKTFKWNSDGSKLVFYGFVNARYSETFIFDPLTRQSTHILYNAFEGPFDWSPDDTQFIGTLNPYSVGEIFVANVDGSGLINLTGDQSYKDGWPSWSPVKLR